MNSGWRSYAWLVTVVLSVACDYHPIDLLPNSGSEMETSGGSSSGGRPMTGGGGGETSSVGGQGGQAGSSPRVMMVVDDVPITTDDVVAARLEALDLEVTRTSEAEVTFEQAENYDLVVVSTSADGAGLGATLRELPRPMLLLEPIIAANQGLGALSTAEATTDMEITAPEHPIVSGLSGTVTICSGAFALVGNQVKPGGTLIGHPAADPTIGVLFAYDEGVDVGTPTPARRVGFGALKPARCQTQVSWGIFDASVAWLLDD